MKLVPKKFRHTVERRGRDVTIVIEDAPHFQSYEHEAQWWYANCGQMDRLTVRYARPHSRLAFEFLGLKPRSNAARLNQASRLNVPPGGAAGCRSPIVIVNRHGREQRIHTTSIPPADHTKGLVYPPK